MKQLQTKRKESKRELILGVTEFVIGQTHLKNLAADAARF